MTDAMILYAQHMLDEPHLKHWYQTFGYQDMLGKVAMKGWQCLICDEQWTRTYKPDPKLQGQPPQTIRALFYSALTHHKEAHSRDALEFKAGLPPCDITTTTPPSGPSKLAAVAEADSAPILGNADVLVQSSGSSERGQPGPAAVVSSIPAVAGEPCLHDNIGININALDKPEGFYCKDCGERVG